MEPRSRPRALLPLFLALLLAASAAGAAKSTLQLSTKKASSLSPLRFLQRGGDGRSDLSHQREEHAHHRRSRRDDDASQQTCVPPVYNTTSKR